MILIINEFGVSISKDNLCLKICKGEEVRLISPSKLSAIHICKPCSLSSPALLLATEFEIPVLFISSTGRVKSKCAAPVFANHATIRRNQVHFTEGETGLIWMRKLLTDKYLHQVQNLNYLANRVKEQEATIQKNIAKINLKMTANESSGIIALRVVEAHISKLYWQSLAAGLQKYTTIINRSKHPANDEFNCVINYLYGMLYSVVDTACITAGLDTQLGIMHSDDYLKPALVYDAIEPFRPWVDRIAIDLFLKNEVNESCFEKEYLAYSLTAAGKKIVIPEFFRIIEERTYYNSKRIKRRDQIQHLLTTLAQYLLKQYKKP